FIRNVTRKFADVYLRFLLVFTVDYSKIVFVFPDYERKDVGTSKLITTRLTIDKEEIHYTDVEILSNLWYDGEKNWRDVWRKWKKAFSVERVTEKFFDDYKTIFFRIRDYVLKQGVSRRDAHEFTLQLLNRTMFIYFISKKNWLGYKKFIEWLWTEYKVTHEKDLFYEKWLKQIFLKAFNNRGHEVEGLPSHVREVILDAPYLNGGLFTKNELDELEVSIDDSLTRDMLFNFFERYNFTIKEDMPLDKEVAVDPQMIGYVYESLANVAEEIYDRNDMGIFYTPRVEVHFMCGRALVEYLSKNMLDVPKDKFYHLVFDPIEEKEKIEKYFEEENLWKKLEECLDNLSVVDPACGSGAFLVGMLNVLTEIYKMIYKHRVSSLTDFELKNRVVGKCLYGVDVMPWAIHAAELRLWLQLIVGTEFKKEELKKHALLPNLNMNLRVGDSLVQEIGEMNLHLRDTNLSENLRRKLFILKTEKEKYFNNDPSARFKTKQELEEEELSIFEEIIDERLQFLEEKSKKLEYDIDKLSKTKQEDLFGGVSEEKQKEIVDLRKGKQKILERILKEYDELKQVRDSLEHNGERPFVWDIDFAEIFGDKGGFDIVIGNPPYVRQEKISPPNKTKAEVTLSDRREYKEKLIKSVRNVFPVIKKIDRKSDYYVYFYFHGLGLLNEKGVFCFITSNSWLDVGYGKDLQEFLLKYVPIIGIYDNPKRSFEHADVNTIIALFGAPVFDGKQVGDLRVQRVNGWSMLDHMAKFVMFKKPFEQVVNAKNLIEIENVDVKVRDRELVELVENVVHTNDYRVFPVTQGDLLEDGWEYE
ncbi:MAG: Eco57I restriction-modification methylase domain-containing protein, partial [Candidatus Heimdallarchaeaceae archaeon]